MNNLKNEYIARIEKVDRLLSLAAQKSRRLMWLRLLTFSLSVALLYLLWTTSILAAVLACLAALAAFGFTATADIRNQLYMKNLARLKEINQNEIASLSGDQSHFYAGSEYFDVKHSYSYDLDIFGEQSIYQLICRALTHKGRGFLAERLKYPLPISQIAEHQQAIAELSEAIDWRQELQAATADVPQEGALDSINQWIKEKNRMVGSILLRLFVAIYPIITITLTILWAVGTLNGLVIFTLLPYFILYGKIGSYIASQQSLVGRSADELRCYSKLLATIEKKEFENPLIISITEKLKVDGLSPSATTRRFAKLVQQLDMRNNIAFMMLIGFFLFWDIRVIIKLERWKQKYGEHLDSWVEAIGELEALSSLANLKYNNPDWCTPAIEKEYFGLQGENIGHPLIPQHRRVDNSFTIGTPSTILLTGSNMAGKSTFLRTLGVNMVLAFAGSDVCAKAFTTSYVHIQTSMRITDSLVENTSSFYAEIKRLGGIVKGIKEGEKPFLLLDEILRGTNSNDRHIGSVALVSLMVELNIAGIIATHDLALSAIKEKYPKSVFNYHFDVQVDNNDELYFDYKVKEGICNSLNASILMRKIGLNV